VFFVDESQRVTIDDIGTAEDIRALAEAAGAHVTEAELFSQFRCNGSDGYLDWLDDVLGIRTAQEQVVDLDYDFRVFDDPNELFAAIAEKNRANNRSRVVAGYCWEWQTSGKDDPAHHDIVIPEWDFARSWNLGSTPTWAIDVGSIDQVGCVHTAQGLEFDYVGVIIGGDMRVENGMAGTAYGKRAQNDPALRGIKKMAKNDLPRAQRVADAVIRNTYRVLMTRGLKGCYVFCTDAALADLLRSSVPGAKYGVRGSSMLLAAEDGLEG
jgi:uncharacterized protein